MKRFFDDIYCLYGAVVRLCFFCIVAGLLLISLTCICYMETSEYVYLCMDAVTSQGIALLCAFLAALGLGLAVRKCKLHCKEAPGFRYILLIFSGVIAIAWVLSTRYIPRADQLSILQFAEHLRKGEYDVFGPGSYMARYPHQSGIVLALCGLSYLWGDGNYVAFQLLNVAAYIVVLWTLGEISAELGRKPILVTVLGVLFLPLLFYTSFLYGTMLGLAMALLAVRETIAYCHCGKLHHGFFAGVFMLLALIIKPNYQIFAIGILIYSVMYLFSKKTWRRWPMLLILVLAFGLGTKLPVYCMEKITDQDLSHGSTTLSWVVMGLHDDGNQAPGRYDGYVWSTLDDAELDTQVQKERVKQDLKERLAYLMENPQYTVKMLLRKTASQWSDPIFEGIWILQQMKSECRIPEWITNIVSPVGSWHISRALNYLHILILFGAALYSCSWKAHFTDESYLLMTIFIGGFLFHMFWEAKGQYTLPYFVLLIPLAVRGYCMVASATRDMDRQSMARLTVPLGMVALCILTVKIYPMEVLWVNLIRFYRYLGI